MIKDWSIRVELFVARVTWLLERLSSRVQIVLDPVEDCWRGGLKEGRELIWGSKKGRELTCDHIGTTEIRDSLGMR